MANEQNKTPDMLRFLKGSQAGLDALISRKDIQIGAFYLTTDTDRLYIGKADNKAALLNNGVQVVANLDDLPDAPPALDGDFYYCKEENIFAVYDKDYENEDGTKGKWIQINVDSYVSEVD
jgi:hypothetical protein